MSMESDISEIRSKLGLTQAQLAEELDVGSNYIYLLEAGRRKPSAKLLRKINALTDVKNEDLQVRESERTYVSEHSLVSVLQEQLRLSQARESDLLRILINLTEGGKK